MVEVSAIVQLTPSNGWYWGSFSVVNPIEKNRTQASDAEVTRLVQALESLPKETRY